MSLCRSLLLVTGLGWSWTAAAQLKTILWPSTFMGYEYNIANEIYDLTCVSEEEWAGMTTLDFAAYDAIAIPDNGVCSLKAIDYAIDSRETWSNAIGGNVFVLGTSSEENQAESASLTAVRSALEYVTSGSTTGLYVSLGCYYRDYDPPSSIEPCQSLEAFRPGPPTLIWGGCSRTAHIMPSAVALAGLGDETISDYTTCGVQEVFRSYPDDEYWRIEAIGTQAYGPPEIEDETTNPTTYGVPYILSRAAVSVGCNNGIYEPNYLEECDPLTPSPLCVDCKCVYGVLDAVEGSCNPEPVCGNGQLEGTEVCDSGLTNGRLDDPCTLECQCAAVDSSTQACIVAPDVCGNDVFEEVYTSGDALEECDAGQEGDENCSTECVCIYGTTNVPGVCKGAPVCGDGYLDPGEQCERQLLGKRDWAGDEICTEECQCRYGYDTVTQTCMPVPVCGNNDKEWTEECDAGTEGDDVCTDICTCIYGVDPDTRLCSPAPEPPITCGDGVLSQETEDCDTAIVGPDLCSPSCTCYYGADLAGEPGSCLPRPTCGNGVVDDDEECDPFYLSKRGAINGLCGSDCMCFFGYDSIAATCNPVPVCGNSIPELGEECDTGVEGDTICAADCTCIYGLTEGYECILPPSNDTTITSSTISSTSTGVSSSVASSDVEPTTTVTSTSPTQTSTVSLALGATTQVSATMPFSNGTSTQRPILSTDIPTTSASLPYASVSSTTPPIASASVDPLPAVVGVFNFVGCTGSDQNYPSFSLELSSDEMDLEMCTTACLDHAYAGVHTSNCYCADNFDNVVTVAKDLCSTPCPGNPAENCGGFRSLARRQATVPDNALLAVYVNPALLAATSTTTLSTASTTASTVTGSVAASNDPDLVSTTTALTTVVLATETVTAVAPGGTTTICIGGYCNTGGYIFEICTGTPAIGEIVFVMEPCSCHGGYSYVPANCTGEACLGETVYKCVPFTGPTGSVTVYSPEPCDHCTGGVTFMPAPPAGGESTVPPVTLIPASSEHTGPATASSTIVVVAGASKLIDYYSSMLLIVGAFAMLLSAGRIG